MASFTSLLNDIYGLTKREDLVTDTKLALKAATLKVHNRDYYVRDHYETGFVFDTSTTIQQLNIYDLLPRFRMVDYIRKSDVNSSLGSFIEFLTPAASIDAYNVNKNNIAYASGSVINIRSSEALQYIIFGCWLNPDTSETTYTSWIADTYPYIIELEAAMDIAGSIGDSEAVKAYYVMLHGDGRENKGYYGQLDQHIQTRAAI